MEIKKRNVFLIILCIVGVIIYMTSRIGMNDITSVINETKGVWLIPAIASILIYWLLETAALYVIVKKLHKPQRFLRTLKTAMLGQFFNGITPFQTGGQPIQVYDMVKSGVPLGITSISLLLKFLIYQTVMTFYSVAILFVKYREFAAKIDNFWFLLLVGLIMNFIVLLTLLLAFFSEKLFVKVIGFIIRFLSRMRLVKNPELKLSYLKDEAANYRDGLKIIKENPLTILYSILISIVQLTAFYIIGYFIYLSLENPVYGVFSLISVQACTQMLSNLVPSPGAIGGAELSSILMLGIYYTSSAKLHMAVLLWRMMTFYLPVLTGTFFLFKIKRKKTGALVDIK